jgi:hypothetical protein
MFQILMEMLTVSFYNADGNVLIESHLVFLMEPTRQ